MPSVELRLDGDHRMLAGLRNYEHSADGAARKVAQALAMLTERHAKRLVTGPPRPPRASGDGGSPGLISGRLRRSIITDRHGHLGAHRYYVDVAPHTPYGRRLELGFTGTDSIGRHYNQPPYPYMRPTLAWLARTAGSRVEGVWRAQLHT